MKTYCIDPNCPNKPKGYAICTALMDVTECPKRKEEEVKKANSKEAANDTH